SGTAHIYGTFSDIDLEGDIYVEDMRLKLNFTNTYYSTSDSIKITPGKITLENVTLSDPYGNTARLDGTVYHTYFREPTFDFNISNVREMLVYNESATANADWYGKIFVNGGATIKGEPGVVKIDVEATTTAGSTFSFVLSELEIADDYTFLTFRDKDAPKVEEIQLDERMGAVERLRALLNKKVDEQFSDYIIELRVNITPEAEIILVMDPVAGDRIRSHGQGNMRMVYTSADNDLRMFGDYTLERGTYNFTLQDIIIKDFIINSGSQIAFTGDPLTAQLNIEAIYSLNANLSDLDESFLQDKELNRTNVPVHAVLKVRGDIQQPEISFDLAFPTLTSDTYRKVRSIVSTEEMMNQQIIYLLALNRFYTPEYMSTSTKGNELFSVASSTISSQLSNILGHLSDKVSVAPNFRSDQGNFSDMEVDVALSSRLLNNRLLLNGNFGYRDNMMNSNQFIGDFQIEYLLNRSGSIRLKAYNVYNDQNYYLRTAETTQGVGVMFKKDFDNIFSFLQPLKSKKEKSKQDVNPDSYNTTTQQQEESQKKVGVQHDRTPFKPESTDSTSSSVDSNATPQLLQFNSKS
ncbi:MAG: translocation/assembly module TamB domain-containing protein, partial [Muribaculaceae bacterium]|nr:translocation/assembly module TamB domain-containing protein [Muribaculaceae bacterium]